jgi:hypothetical protein
MNSKKGTLLVIVMIIGLIDSKSINLHSWTFSKEMQTHGRWVKHIRHGRQRHQS